MLGTWKKEVVQTYMRRFVHPLNYLSSTWIARVMFGNLISVWELELKESLQLYEKWKEIS